MTAEHLPTPDEQIERLKAALREIATRQPSRSAKARMRGLVVQLQSIAINALGESIDLGIDQYDAGKPQSDCPYTGECGNLNMENFR